MRVTFRCDPALLGRIPRPQAARRALPEWLRDMPARAYSEMHGQEVRTLKQCPPFVDAMAFGFVMPLVCDVEVADGRFNWDFDLPPLSIEAHPRSPLSFHVAAQAEGAPFHEANRAFVKFNSFWTIELPPGLSLFAAHPVNRWDLPFRTLSGLVDSDRFHDVGVLFPAAWVDPGFRGVLRAGTPVAQCFAVAREALDLAYEPMSPAQRGAYEETAVALLDKPGVYRRRFRARRGAQTVSD